MRFATLLLPLVLLLAGCQTAAVTGTALAGLAVWGTAVEPRLVATEEERVPIPALPEDWEGQHVAVFADIQVGMWWANTGTVRDAVKEIVAARPALVLFAGDFVYKPDSATVREAVALLRPLADSGIPTIAVLGNHDYSLYEETSEIRPELAAYLEGLVEEMGIPVLTNEAVPVEPPGGGDPLYVAGIGSEWAEEAHPDRALAAVPAEAPRLVLMHNPTTFPRVPAGAAPLAVAGHTHGGQIRIPFLPHTSWLEIIGPDDLVVDGWATEGVGQPGNRLYVNRGIGFSVVPVRINCTPEVTVFQLERGPVREADPEG
jgi:predicted MPP superfamily phosphohydrolase